jgi:hypothetical protein
MISLITECNDGIDNDEDTVIDAADPGCINGEDISETDPEVNPICADGIDNDGDGLTDYPEDTQCRFAGGTSESVSCLLYNGTVRVVSESTIFDVDTSLQDNQYGASCAGGSASGEVPFAVQLDSISSLRVELTDRSDGYDTSLHIRRGDCDDEDAEIECNDDGGESTMSLLEFDSLTPGLYYVFVDGYSTTNTGTITVNVDITSYEVPTTECNDEIDNDEDDLIDYADPGCVDFQDNSEVDPALQSECSDGVDNDEDGSTDYPEDPDCLSAGDPLEASRCLGVSSTDIEVNYDEPTVVVVNPDPVALPVAPSTCGDARGLASVLSFEITRYSDVNINVVEIEAEINPSISVLSLRSDCDVSDQDLECGQASLNTPFTASSVAPGRYYILVERTVNDRTPITLSISLVDRQTECNDGIDNDGDNLIDLYDSGCVNGDSPFELTDPADPTPECADGIDNDENGCIDYPDDGDCDAAGDPFEQELCNNFDFILVTNPYSGTFRHEFQPVGTPNEVVSCATSTSGTVVFAVDLSEDSDLVVSSLDPDGDSAFVYTAIRRECDDAETEIECISTFPSGPHLFSNLDAGRYFIFIHRSSFNDDPFFVEVTALSNIAPVQACADGEDNDEDNLVDANDPGCTDAFDADETDLAEVPTCADGIDNDEDELTDYPNDPDCLALGDNTEALRCINRPTLDITVPYDDEGVQYTILPSDFTIVDDQGTCAETTVGESTILSFDVPELSLLKIELNTESQEDYHVFLRSECDLAESEAFCFVGLGNGFELQSNLLEAGRYFLFVKKTSRFNTQPIQVGLRLVSQITECNDGLDNNQNALIDLDDPGCFASEDSSEFFDDDVLPECADSVDNDEDGQTDYPSDPECRGAGDNLEERLCLNNDAIEITTSGSYLISDLSNDFHEPSCAFATGGEAVFYIPTTEQTFINVSVFDLDGSSASVYRTLKSTCDGAEELACEGTGGGGISNFEVDEGGYFLIIDRTSFGSPDPLIVNIDLISAVTECNDEIDNDNDLLIDQDDPGCESDRDTSEEDPAVLGECADGVDNDEDGQIDYPQDLECLFIGYPSESPYCESADTFAAIVNASGLTEVSTNTTGSPAEYTSLSCGRQARSSENVIAVVLQETSTIDVNMVNGSYDSVLHIRRNCDDPLSEIICDDDGGDVGLLSAAVLPNLAPGVYYVFIDGFGTSASGTATVNITVTPQEPQDTP